MNPAKAKFRKIARKKTMKCHKSSAASVSTLPNCASFGCDRKEARNWNVRSSVYQKRYIRFHSAQLVKASTRSSTAPQLSWYCWMASLVGPTPCGAGGSATTRSTT